MTSERSPDVKFEIGHVLFIDIVGYSKLLITEQSEQIQKLKQIVRGTEQVRLAEAEGKLLRLPTGDGGALVFRTSPEAPVLCAMEISKALKNHPELHVRMGIHSGPVNEVTDLNEQANIAGAGINMAQRIMDCGDAGHILLSRRVADDLKHYGRWRPYLHEIGERKAGEKLRVTAQLINVSDGYHLWSEDYDGDVNDILNLQSNVALRVVQALQMKLGGDETRVLAKKPTENPEAHRLYLLGRYEFAKYTQTGWNNAIHYYEQALKLDPNYALAYCGLADNYAYMGSVMMPEKEAIAKEKEFAQKALALDPELAEAHMSFALTLVADYDWRNGLREFDRALELNPNLAFAYELQAWTVNGLGRFDEAIAKTRKAVELDPLNPFFQMSLSFYQYWARQYDNAIAQARKTLEMDPNSTIARVLLGLSFLKKGDTGGAIAELQKTKAPDPGAWYQGFLGYAYAVSGDRAKAEQALRELEELAKRQYVSPTAFVTIYLGLGEKEKALDSLEKAYEEQDSACWYLKIDQIYDSVRNEPRFQAILKKVGLE